MQLIAMGDMMENNLPTDVAEVHANLLNLISIMADSEGIAGWHLNGDVQGWDHHPVELQAAADMIKRLSDQVETFKLITQIGIDLDLSSRMVAAGMIPLDAVVKFNPMSMWMRDTSVKDLPSFVSWIKHKYMEYSRVQAAKATGDMPLNPDIDDFILGKSGAYHDVWENLAWARLSEERDDS